MELLENVKIVMQIVQPVKKMDNMIVVLVIQLELLNIYILKVLNKVVLLLVLLDNILILIIPVKNVIILVIPVQNLLKTIA